jgi:hypothetical protein
MCGVQTTFSIVNKGSRVSSSGLVDVDGRHAGRPVRNALPAPGRRGGARLVLTRSAVGFIRARSAVVTMPRVASTRRM